MPVAVPETVRDPEKVQIDEQATPFEILNVFEVTEHAYRMFVLNDPVKERKHPLTVVAPKLEPNP
jgi:hypothetical protein